MRGSGPYIWDQHGKRYLDGLSGLFVVQAGHGRTELAEAAAKQAAELAYFPLWSYAHPTAIELAERLAGLTPGDLNRVFFTTGGSEAVESAWKLARSYFKLAGKPMKTKAISRSVAYHGTTMGALSITGLPALKQQFEPLVPGTFRVPNTNYYRRPDESMSEEQFGLWAADRIAEAIEFEGPDTVACVFLEPVQNAGGCFPPPPGYFQRVREICDRYDVLLVSDEVICAFGRLGEYFGSARYGYTPDIITVRQGPDLRVRAAGRDDRLGAAGRAVPAPATRRSRTASPSAGTRSRPRWPWPTWTSSSARTSTATSAPTPACSGRTWRSCSDLPIVGDVRGDGYFFGIELVKDKATKETFNEDESDRLLRGFLSQALFDAGPVLPRRRPRRPGHPARAAAGLRGVALRRDGADPAHGADRGLDAALSPSFWLDSLGPVDASAARCPATAPSTWRSSAAATPACGPRTTWPGRIRRCGSWCWRRSTAGFGASGRNGGWCSGLFPVPAAKLARRYGAEPAAAMHRALAATVDEVGRVAAAEGIDCHYAKGGTITLARSAGPVAPGPVDAARRGRSDARRGAGDLRRDRRARRRPTARTARRSTRPGWCAAWPRRWSGCGVTIHEGTRALRIARGSVATDHGTVRADVVVRALEGYTADAARAPAGAGAGLLADDRHRAAAGRGLGADRAGPAGDVLATSGT